MTDLYGMELNEDGMPCTVCLGHNTFELPLEAEVMGARELITRGRYFVIFKVVDGHAMVLATTIMPSVV